jgi:hypothetical protein
MAYVRRCPRGKSDGQGRRDTGRRLAASVAHRPPHGGGHAIDVFSAEIEQVTVTGREEVADRYLALVVAE